MKLKEGKMSTRELSEWFGIAYSTYRKKSLSLLEELKYFCDYEKYYGGVEIKHVYISKYVKNKENITYGFDDKYASGAS